MDIPVQGGRFGKQDDRFPALAISRCGCREKPSSACNCVGRSHSAASHQRGRPSGVPCGGSGPKTILSVGTALSMPSIALHEQHLEQDHRYVKKRVVASQWFRSLDGVLKTIAVYEAINIIRKGQIRWCRKPTLFVRCGSLSSFSALLSDREGATFPRICLPGGVCDTADTPSYRFRSPHLSTADWPIRRLAAPIP